MQHLDSGTPSGLQLRQPQRYSDRHQTKSNSGQYKSRGPRAAQVDSPQDSSTQIDEGGHDGKSDDDQGIKSYLKKTDAAANSRAAKPGKATQVDEFEATEKEG